MMTSNKGAVVMAIGLVLGAVSTARSQGLAPTPFGPARMPEPVPCAPSQPLAPGPIAPLDAPQGPPPSLSLPVNHSSAFQNEDFPPEEGLYVHLGAMGLQRQGLGLTIGTLADAPGPAQDLSTLTPDTAFGVRGSVGYLFNDSMLEVTGFTIPQNSVFAQTDRLGNVNVPFTNRPTGFEGIGIKGDSVRTTLTSGIWDVELNYRYNDVAFLGFELIMGIRYLNQHDELDLIANQGNARTNPDLQGKLLYDLGATNQLVAPQLGFEYQHNLFKYLSFGMTAKAAWGANFADVDSNVHRGDGLLAFNVDKNDVIFSDIYEMNFFVEFHILERLRLRGGYDLMWLCQWATAPSNFNLNLGAPQAPGYDFNRNGSIFYHGPTVELEFLF